MRMRAFRLLTIALAAAVVAGPVMADEMQDAMDKADALNFFRQINLQPAQARQMVAPLQRIQGLVGLYNSSRTSALKQLKPTLEQARRQLVAGNELSDQMVAALESYQQQRQAAQVELYRTVDAEMQAIAGILTPEQNQYLDWTPPGSIRPEQAMEERLEMQRLAMGRIEEAAQVLDRIKHLDAFNFVTGRGPIVNDYLSLYFRPDTPQYRQAYEMVIAYSDQVRMLEEAQWQAQAYDIAAGLVQELGLMPTMETGPRPGTISWQTLFRLFTNAQTLEVVREMGQ